MDKAQIYRTTEDVTKNMKNIYNFYKMVMEKQLDSTTDEMTMTNDLGRSLYMVTFVSLSYCLQC